MPFLNAITQCTCKEDLKKERERERETGTCEPLQEERMGSLIHIPPPPPRLSDVIMVKAMVCNRHKLTY
jgi:hypothetical protein